MTGTIVVGVTDTPEGRGAAQLAAALGERLGLRLVLAHVVDAPPAALESVTTRQGLSGGERTLAEIAREVTDNGADVRVVVGRRAERLAQIAAEEGADVIVLGSRPQGMRGRGLRCSLARELEAATPAPVVIAPPQTRKRSERRLAAADLAAAG